MDLWDENLRKERLAAIRDGDKFPFFFQKDGDLFGAPEASRVAFARLKNPDDEDKEWAAEGSFVGFNLKNALDGDNREHPFSAKDLDHIKVLDKKEAIKLLEKQ